MQIANWPSKTKADAISIITALCVVGMESQVVFYTDSKSLKKQFERMTKRDAMQYVVDKEANWPIWSSIRTIAAKKELKVEIIYKESINNNTRTNNVETPIAINYHDLGYATRVLRWNNTLIEQKTRRFIRNLQNAEAMATWHSQNRNHKWQSMTNIK